MECAPGRRLGRPEDRRACGARRAVVVGAGPTALRAGGRRSTVELALARGSAGSCPLVTAGAGRARARARARREPG